eukprot:GHVU01006722.1.p1 GENE.GHVU01006722.1~~GHVU01006722.1.p1  ORF type:complete len:106 (-),score=0.23 GHVU01006722.1:255-572(-)
MQITQSLWVAPLGLGFCTSIQLLLALKGHNIKTKGATLRETRLYNSRKSCRDEINQCGCLFMAINRKLEKNQKDLSGFGNLTGLCLAKPFSVGVFKTTVLSFPPV